MSPKPLKFILTLTIGEGPSILCHVVRGPHFGPHLGTPTTQVSGWQDPKLCAHPKPSHPFLEISTGSRGIGISSPNITEIISQASVGLFPNLPSRKQTRLLLLKVGMRVKYGKTAGNVLMLGHKPLWTCQEQEGEKKRSVKVVLASGIGQILFVLSCSDENLAFSILIRIYVESQSVSCVIVSQFVMT